VELYMTLGVDTELGLGEGGDGRKVGMEESSHDVDDISRNFREGNDEGSLKILDTLSLPSELMSFAFTYEKSYSSSLFLGDSWTADMPLRIRPQRSPKAKFGCLTCKVRRVKCDELKPTCLRCQKLGLKCGGYHAPQRESTRSHPAITTRRAMGPKMLFLYPRSLPEVNLFHTNREYHYFKVFSEELRQKGEQSVLLQMCQREHLLKRAIVALVALEKTRKTSSVSGSSVGSTKHSVDHAVEYGNVTKDEGEPRTRELVERSRRKHLLSFMDLIYFKRKLIEQRYSRTKL